MSRKRRALDDSIDNLLEQYQEYCDDSDQRCKRLRTKAKDQKQTIEEQEEKIEELENALERAKEAIKVRNIEAGVPEEWEAIDTDHNNSTLLKLDSNNKNHAEELEQVDEEFDRTMSTSSSVISVYRVQNRKLHRKFEAELKKVLAAGGKEMKLWHGTSQNKPALIHATKTGFDPDQGTRCPGHVWFHRDASYSANYAHMANNQ